MRFHGDAAASAVEDAAVNYQSPSIIAAGASAQSVSVLTMLVNLSLSLLCIKAPGLIERLGMTKKGAMTLAYLNLCAWVPLILAFLLSPLGIQPVWYALLWLVNIMPGILLTFQRDNWLSGLVPRGQLGRYLGQRLAIKSAFYLGAFCFLGYLLDSFGTASLVNFTFLFMIALVVALADFVIFTFMHEPQEKEVSLPKPEPPKIKFGIFDFIGELKTKKLDTFVIFTSLFYLTVGLSGPLYAVYMLQEQHFTYLSFTVIIAAEFLARVISAPFWGRFADKAGNIRVLGIVSRVIPVIPIGWLFCSNIGYLAFIQVLSGICWGAFDLCTQSYIFKVAPAEKKLRYIVYTRCFILFSTAVGGLAGAYLVQGVFPIFGSRLLSIFMISGFFRAAVVMYLIPKLVDLAVSYARPKKSPTVNLDTSGRAALKHGLYYCQPETAAPTIKNKTFKKNGAPLSADARITTRRNWPVDEKLEKAQPAKAEIPELSEGLHNISRRKWAVPVKSIEKKKAVASLLVVTHARRAWFNDPEMIAAYAARSRNPSLLAMEKNAKMTTSREGLYYNGAGWAQYVKESLRAALKEGRERRGGGRLEPVLVESDLAGVPGTICNRDLLTGRR